MKYKEYVILEGEYEDIEANDPEEAFIIASDYAINGVYWQHDIIPQEEKCLVWITP